MNISEYPEALFLKKAMMDQYYHFQQQTGFFKRIIHNISKLGRSVKWDRTRFRLRLTGRR
jgi:hypothetical protein